VDKNLVGFSESSRAVFAPLLPFFLALSSLNLREETRDISDMENIPLSKIRPIIIIISKIQVINVDCGYL
jgi:type II secretory pathway component PulK